MSRNVVVDGILAEIGEIKSKQQDLLQSNTTALDRVSSVEASLRDLGDVKMAVDEKINEKVKTKSEELLAAMNARLAEEMDKMDKAVQAAMAAVRSHVQVTLGTATAEVTAVAARVDKLEEQTPQMAELSTTVAALTDKVQRLEARLVAQERVPSGSSTSSSVSSASSSLSLSATQTRRTPSVAAVDPRAAAAAQQHLRTAEKPEFGVAPNSTEPPSESTLHAMQVFVKNPLNGASPRERVGKVDINLSARAPKQAEVWRDSWSRIEDEMMDEMTTLERQEELWTEMFERVRTGGKSMDLLVYEFEGLSQQPTESVAAYKQRAMAMASRVPLPRRSADWKSVVLRRFCRGLRKPLREKLYVKFGSQEVTPTVDIHTACDFLQGSPEEQMPEPAQLQQQQQQQQQPAQQAMVAAIGAGQRRGPDQRPDQRMCIRCHGVGHQARHCPQPTFAEITPRDHAQLARLASGALSVQDKACYRCQQSGHVVRFCPAPHPVASHSAFVISPPLPSFTEAEMLGEEDVMDYPNEDGQGMF
jgi:hypothetical protein